MVMPQRHGATRKKFRIKFRGFRASVALTFIRYFSGLK